MGNRAVITTRERKVGLYLHWNGGRDSVEAFLRYCELRGFRPPSSDNYGWARLCQVIGNYMGADGLSVGIGPYSSDDAMDPGDNGIYVIEGWKIVERVGLYDGFEEQDEYPLPEMLRAIDEAQPEGHKLGDLFFDSTSKATCDINPGDLVFLPVIGGTYETFEVVAIARAGTLYPGYPVVSRYGKDGEVDMSNPNNYLREEGYMVV